MTKLDGLKKSCFTGGSISFFDKNFFSDRSVRFAVKNVRPAANESLPLCFKQDAYVCVALPFALGAC
jgi:hypothetical protein